MATAQTKNNQYHSRQIYMKAAAKKLVQQKGDLL